MPRNQPYPPQQPDVQLIELPLSFELVEEAPKDEQQPQPRPPLKQSQVPQWFASKQIGAGE